MKIKKAVIPAAGLGTRVLPASKSMPKEMLPIVDKPAIQYIVEEAVKSGIEDIRQIGAAAVKSFDHAVRARQYNSMDEVRKVGQYEDEVDNLEEEFREKHVERLSNGECNASSGMVFMDIISNLERVSDHAYNLAGYIKDEM